MRREQVISDHQRTGYILILSGVVVVLFALVLLPTMTQLMPARYPSWIRTVWLVVGGILFVVGAFLNRRQ